MKRATDFSRQTSFLGSVGVITGLSGSDMTCGKCGFRIPDSLVSCPHCAQRESEIADQLVRDECVRRGREILQRGGIVYPILTRHREKSEDRKEITVLSRHLRHRDSARFVLCGKAVSPKASGLVPMDAAEIKNREARNPGLHCPDCLAVVAGAL